MAKTTRKSITASHGEGGKKSAPSLALRTANRKKFKGEPIERPEGPAKKSPAGRGGTLTKIEYRPEFAGEAQRLAQAGYDVPRIAEYFGVSPSQINKWKTIHPDFGRAVGYGKVDFLTKSVASLEKLVEGPLEVQTSYAKDKETGEMVEVGRKEIRHKPDMEAVRFNLIANDPERWAVTMNREHDTGMSMAASVAIVDTILKRLAPVERGGDPNARFGGDAYAEPAIIIDEGYHDETRIVGE